MRYIITLIATATPALAEVPKVVTDIPPVHALVAQVMGDLGQPELLLTPGADEHDFQLRPSQVRSIATADLVVWIGPELTPWLDKALAATGDASATLTLSGQSPVTRSYAEAKPDGEDQDHGDDHEHDHGTDDDHGHDHDHEAGAGHAHTGLDPHLWLDPDNAQAWLGLIAGQLARQDAANAATYLANADAARAEIAALDARIAALLEPVKDRPILTYHDAYGYFAERYGLTVLGSIAEGDASAPGAARLAGLRDEVAAGQGVCLFPEVQHDPKLIAQLAEATGARVGGALDPVGSTLEPGPGAYGALLQGLAETIAGCAGG